ncbi:MAG: hypothetical protein ACRCZB_05580 [Bacteroidales bacterium]
MRELIRGVIMFIKLCENIIVKKDSILVLKHGDGINEPAQFTRITLTNSEFYLFEDKNKELFNTVSSFLLDP